VVSSHYDSVRDRARRRRRHVGTAALLETARIMAGIPMPATIVFASFTGEEAGLLGSREFVRRAVEDKAKIVGALNNDMIGWANDHRLDNTIRTRTPASATSSTPPRSSSRNLITYDALYYKSTDAAAYYEAYGDIVGGIGSYPCSATPLSPVARHARRHQPPADRGSREDDGGTLMLLASSPSRTTGLKVDSYQNGTAALSWTPNPEKGITATSWRGAGRQAESQQMRVTTPRHR
jgi:hypothetical protein